MTTWYHAVCDKHRQHAVVLVTFNGRRERNCDPAHGIPGVAFLDDHVGCDLRLIHRDGEFDGLDDYAEVEAPDGPLEEMHLPSSAAVKRFIVYAERASTWAQDVEFKE